MIGLFYAICTKKEEEFEIIQTNKTMQKEKKICRNGISVYRGEAAEYIQRLRGIIMKIRDFIGYYPDIINIA